MLHFNSCREHGDASLFQYFSVCSGCVTDVAGSEGFILKFMFGKTLRRSSRSVMVRNNLDCREICEVAAVVKYRQAAESMHWSLAGGSGFLFTSVLEGEDKGELAFTPT